MPGNLLRLPALQVLPFLGLDAATNRFPEVRCTYEPLAYWGPVRGANRWSTGDRVPSHNAAYALVCYPIAAHLCGNSGPALFFIPFGVEPSRHTAFAVAACRTILWAGPQILIGIFG